MESIEIEKAVLRRELLKKRKELPGLTEKGKRIQKLLISLPCFKEAERILFYVNLSEEPATDLLMEEARRQRKAVYVPRCFPGGTISFYRIRGREELSPGSYGILEPPEREEALLQETSQKDLCLVPGVSFDEEGFRLGYGKGYYDRFLAGKRLHTVGLCFKALLASRLPRETWDQRVELVLTEQGIVSCPTERKEVDLL